MQTTKQFQTNGVDVTKLHVSGYQLTTALLRGGIARLELNNTASLVLLYLASCYNGGAIFRESALLPPMLEYQKYLLRGVLPNF